MYIAPHNELQHTHVSVCRALRVYLVFLKESFRVCSWVSFVHGQGDDLPAVDLVAPLGEEGVGGEREEGKKVGVMH